ncbi:MAG: hypothetical protein Q8P56_01790 [Candidatus Uhrbacteria bacterium]|nr:hypothetical protein [Candidatus Uhrbacteria bacterium]
MKTCAQCKEGFTVFDEDRGFYKKINVPEPTWCPDCRNMRRCARRNERVLYMRTCDLCKKQTLSTYRADALFPVYCRTCWWSRDWDALVAGRELDFSRSFFEQFNELALAVPHIALDSKEMENSNYCQYAEGLKDSYLAICSYFGKNLLYAYWTGWVEDLVDCNLVLHSERLFECQDIQKSYGCRYVYRSAGMTDSILCFECSDCVSCYMCVNLRHKSYCIKNVQYTKEEYEREMQKVNCGSYENIERAKKEFWDFVSTHPRKYASLKKSENCIGDCITESKDVYNGFDVFGFEGGRYLYDAGGPSRDCMDFLQSGIDCELDYEGQDGGWLYNTHFANSVGHLSDSEYMMMSGNCQDCFGCFGLQKKQYCILNKQYSKEEYEVLRGKIIEHMRKTGEHGEFFPIQHSPYAYNETIAQQWYPKTKEEVSMNGWRWCDDLPGKYDPPTIQWADIPDDISGTPDDVIKNVFACQKCRKNYRVIKQEFEVYKNRAIPLPRLCPDCRFYTRLSYRNPRKLWHRQCMCELVHDSHANKRCPVEFETSYAPERKELIYCAECYEREVA